MTQHKTNDILLESGTNELSMLEFTLAGSSFGINVAKVKSLNQYEPAQPMPHAHPCIEGIIHPRNETYTVVDVAAYLGLPPSADPNRDIYIITTFNQMSIAFHVHSVNVIHRVSWQSIEKPDKALYGGDDGAVTGIAKVDGRMVSIVDFEKIIADISPGSSIQPDAFDISGPITSTQKPVLVAEDSIFLRKVLIESLHNAGFNNIISTDNGQEAWNKLLDYKSRGGRIVDHVHCLITDIEMPQMDGLRLTKLVKGDSQLKDIPVIVFSSLIDENMKRKCKEVGADASLSKPDIEHLVVLLNNFMQEET